MRTIPNTTESDAVLKDESGRHCATHEALTRPFATPVANPNRVRLTTLPVAPKTTPK